MQARNRCGEVSDSDKSPARSKADFAAGTRCASVQKPGSISPIVALARRCASARSGRAAHGTYCTISAGARRPAARADSQTASTATRVKSGGHMLEIISPSAILPHSASACSPRAAMSSGMSARSGRYSSLALCAEKARPL